MIQNYIDWIAEVKVVPGEKEMDALYRGAVNGDEQAKNYSDH